jgi:F-type H+-transporting ATPase subunit a
MDSILRFGNMLAWASEEHASEASHGGGHHVLSWNGLMLYILFVVAIIFVFLSIAKKGFTNRTFVGAPARLAEHLYLFIENLAVSVMGNYGRKYIPILYGFWSVIFVSNIVALFFASAPTANLSFNLALALCAVLYVQWEGIKQNGFFGHFAHFAGPKLPGILILINFLIFGIELISELMKNVSLSLRLFGNIDGGHQAVLAMNSIAKLNLGGEDIFLPLGYLLIPIKLLTCVVQALVFTLLLCVYLSLVTHDPAEHAHGHAEAH